MKFETSFVPRAERWAAGAALLFLALAVTGVAIAAWLPWSAARMRRDLPAMELTAHRLRERSQRQTPALPPPSGRELNALKQRVAFLNALEIGGGRGIPALLARLERLLPARVALESLQIDREHNEIRLVARAAGADALSRFLSALERDACFAKVRLLKQERRSAVAGGSDVTFTIRAEDRRE